MVIRVGLLQPVSRPQSYLVLPILRGMASTSLPVYNGIGLSMRKLGQRGRLDLQGVSLRKSCLLLCL